MCSSSPPRPSVGPRPWRHSGTRREEGGGTHTTIIITMEEMGGWWLFFTFTPSRPMRKAPSPLPNACYRCCRRRVGGGGGGCCRILLPRLPRPRFPSIFPLSLYLFPTPIVIYPPAPRALRLRPQPRTRPCPRPWPRLPPKFGSSTISPPLLGFARLASYSPPGGVNHNR